MAVRLHLVPIPSTFTKSKVSKPSPQNPFSVSSSLFFSNSSISTVSAITTSRKQCRNLLVFQISSTTQEQSSSSTTTTTTIEETTPITSSEKETRTRVFAQNVPWTYTMEDIKNLFEKYGNVIDIELPMFDQTRNRGLAFVTMGSAEEAAAAITNLQLCELEGRVINMMYNIQQRKKSSSSTVKIVPKFNVFVGNLDFSATSADLREFFSSMKVVSAEVIYRKKESTMSTGDGFVAFGTKEEAEKAFYTFKGKMLMGRPVRLSRSKRNLTTQRKTDKKKNQVEETSTEVKSGE